MQVRGRRIVVAPDHDQPTCGAVLPKGGDLLGDPCSLTGVGNAPQPGPLGLGGGAHAVQHGLRNRAGADDRRLPSHGQRGREERPLPRCRVGGGSAAQDREHPRPRSVGELAAELPVSRSAVSQHLKILKDAGLVAERAEGTRRIYRVNPVALAALRDQLETYWQRSLTRYADLVALDEGPNDDVAPDPEENR